MGMIASFHGNKERATGDWRLGIYTRSLNEYLAVAYLVRVTFLPSKIGP